MLAIKTLGSDASRKNLVKSAIIPRRNYG